MITELHLYDFDGTLFRSPEKPSGFRGSNWWGAEESLGRPCVPDVPDASWWIGSTVREARASLTLPHVVTALATGRGDNTFARWRVPELLDQINLGFDGVHLAPQTGVAKQFKALVIERYVQRYPGIRKVKAWEDTKPNVDVMARVCADLGLDFEFILVNVPAMKVDCPPAEPRPEVVASRWAARDHG